MTGCGINEKISVSNLVKVHLQNLRFQLLNTVSSFKFFFTLGHIFFVLYRKVLAGNFDSHKIKITRHYAEC